MLQSEPNLASPPPQNNEPQPLQAQWVFGYGSLMWNPEFLFSESSLARVHGYHRSFCIQSTLYRGTPQQPGVVLGLDRGGSVDGLAFKIAEGHELEAVRRLYVREMVGNIYNPKVLTVRLRDGREVQALTFVANRGNSSYQTLSECEIVARLSRCEGQRGPNCDYAINTHALLKELGVRDLRLQKLVDRLKSLPPTQPKQAVGLSAV